MDEAALPIRIKPAPTLMSQGRETAEVLRGKAVLKSPSEAGASRPAWISRNSRTPAGNH
jgi:hypothetical protein